MINTFQLKIFVFKLKGKLFYDARSPEVLFTNTWVRQINSVIWPVCWSITHEPITNKAQQRLIFNLSMDEKN